MASNTSTRRGILGAMALATAGVASAGAATVASATVPATPEWQAVLRAYTKAKAIEDSFDAKHFGHINSQPIGPKRNALCDAVPKSSWDTVSALAEARCEAERALMACPSPHLAAVIFKIEMARARWVDFEDWPDDWWNHVMTDLRRLAAA